MGPFLCARPPPAWSSMGGGSGAQTPCLFAPADDRNAPATPTAGWRRQLPAVQFNRSCMAQHVRMHVEGSRPHDENSLGSGTRFEETTIQRWCCRLSWAHNHKSASEPVCTALSTRFLGPCGPRTVNAACLFSPTHAINLNLEHWRHSQNPLFEWLPAGGQRVTR